MERLILTVLLALPASAALAQLTPVIVEAESGVLGSEYTTGVDGATTYVMPTTTGGSDNPGTADRLITYSVTFPHAGVWELYARMYVGPATYSDDSFFYGSGFGVKNPTLGTDWITANQFADPSGYTLPGDKVVSGGPATSQTWKWVKLSAWSNPEPAATFTVPDGVLTQTFQIGRREDGFRFDKFAFGPQTFEGNQVYFTVNQLDNGLPGTTEPPPPPYIPPGPPIATCHTKFLGSVSSTTQIVNFDAYFNQITPENGGKWGSVEATRDVMNWTDLDAAYARAQTNGIPFRLHTLIWGNQQPAWIESLPPSTQFVEIVEWFSAVAERYPDIDFVEVVNEPLHDPPDGPGDGNYIEALGGTGTTGWDWVINAFALARAFFPNAKLSINDYSVTNDGAAMQQYITIIQLLQAQGLIDVVGIQGHAFSTRVPAATITANLDVLYAATGLPVHVTELDIDGPSDEIQLADYQRIFPAFWEHPAVEGITLWGYRPGMWRTPQGAYIAHQNGAERPALQWLLTYVNPSLAIKPMSVARPAAAGTGTVAVVAPTQAGCTPIDWTAVSNDTWITVTSGGSGTDAGTVGYSVDENVAGARTGTVTISGQTFTVNQAAAACSYGIDPVSVSAPSEGASGTVAVTTGSWCNWTAVSNDAWITVTSGASGPGSGTVGYTVAANVAGARAGTITIAGQTFTVNQVTLPAYLLTVSGAGTGTGTVTSSPGGISCGLDCSENYYSGTVVTLTAAATVDSIFTGWSGGGCTGSGQCLVTMDGVKDVTATFTLRVAGFWPVTPCRLFDSRESAFGPALSAGATREVEVGGNCFIPAEAKAVSVNVTVLGSTSAGNLRMFPAGAAMPVVSAINYGAGQTRANNAVVQLGAGGAVSVFCEQASGTVHLVVDVSGYFLEEPAGATTAGQAE